MKDMAMHGRAGGPLAATIARLSADEMAVALRLARAPAPVRHAGRAALLVASRPLGRMLERFDERIGARGIALAAEAALADLGACWTREGAAPAEGPLLVVANHPGAYDTLLLLAAIGRRDVAIVAADRVFLRAMPGLSRHLLFAPDDEAAGRGGALKRALRHLRRGGALLHFGAGRIEPDPAFAPPGSPLLEPWPAGTGALVRGAARTGGRVVAAITEGVHSPRAKRMILTRLAERRGITTLALLLQIAVPAYHDVRARVRFSVPVDARALIDAAGDEAITDRVRRAALDLLCSPRP